MGDFPTRRDIAAGYDRAASGYTEEFAAELDRKPFDRDLLTEFAAATAGRGLVLDVGCGPGHVAAFLAARGVDVGGVDISARMAAIGRLRQPAIPFAVADMLSLPVASSTLAGIAAVYSLIHLPRGLVPQALAELRGALRADGRLLLAVHAGHGEVHRDSWYGRPVKIAATLFQTDELLAGLATAGFAIESCSTRPPYRFEYPSERIYVMCSPGSERGEP
ncbi:MAG TPA: class I SAM-dependent methyltransferase [Acidimicrobiia bacterium]